MRRIALLGPQRLRPFVSRVLDEIAGEGPLAVVTAGWQEREEEVDELADHVRRRVTNLRLHGRAEEVFERHPQLFEAHRQRQDELKDLQRLYRLRLDHALEPARRLLRRKEPAELLEAEQESAIEAVRALDRHHESRLAAAHARFEQRWGAALGEALEGHLHEISAVLADAAAVAIAGGHVAVLLNRLRMFGLAERVRELPVVAWSAGAMALAERVMLFHDRPPQGAGNAEVLELGLGLVPGVVPLPHAATRLRLDDPVRVALLARRFAPAACIALDAGSSLSWDGETLRAGRRTRRLLVSGRVKTLRAAA